MYPSSVPPMIWNAHAMVQQLVTACLNDWSEGIKIVESYIARDVTTYYHTLQWASHHSQLGGPHNTSLAYLTLVLHHARTRHTGPAWVQFHSTLGECNDALSARVSCTVAATTYGVAVRSLYSNRASVPGPTEPTAPTGTFKFVQKPPAVHEPLSAIDTFYESKRLKLPSDLSQELNFNRPDLRDWDDSLERPVRSLRYASLRTMGAWWEDRTAGSHVDKSQSIRDSYSSIGVARDWNLLLDAADAGYMNFSTFDLDAHARVDSVLANLFSCHMSNPGTSFKNQGCLTLVEQCDLIDHLWAAGLPAIAATSSPFYHASLELHFLYLSIYRCSASALEWTLTRFALSNQRLHTAWSSLVSSEWIQTAPWLATIDMGQLNHLRQLFGESETVFDSWVIAMGFQQVAVHRLAMLDVIQKQWPKETDFTTRFPTRHDVEAYWSERAAQQLTESQLNVRVPRQPSMDQAIEAAAQAEEAQLSAAQPNALSCGRYGWRVDATDSIWLGVFYALSRLPIVVRHPHELKRVRLGRRDAGPINMALGPSRIRTPGCAPCGHLSNSTRPPRGFRGFRCTTCDYCECMSCYVQQTRLLLERTLETAGLEALCRVATLIRDYLPLAVSDVWWMSNVVVNSQWATSHNETWYFLRMWWERAWMQLRQQPTLVRVNQLLEALTLLNDPSDLGVVALSNLWCQPGPGLWKQLGIIALPPSSPQSTPAISDLVLFASYDDQLVKNEYNDRLAKTENELVRAMRRQLRRLVPTEPPCTVLPMVAPQRMPRWQHVQYLSYVIHDMASHLAHHFDCRVIGRFCSTILSRVDHGLDMATVEYPWLIMSVQEGDLDECRRVVDLCQLTPATLNQMLNRPRFTHDTLDMIVESVGGQVDLQQRVRRVLVYLSTQLGSRFRLTPRYNTLVDIDDLWSTCSF